MKKIIFGSIASLAIATVVALNVNMSAQGEKLSDVSLANVEALAGGEVIVGFVCYNRVNKYCLQFPGESYEEIWYDMDYA